MNWTDDRVERLKVLWAEGRTAGEIAAELGERGSRNAVIGKAHRLGLSRRPSPIVAIGCAHTMKATGQDGRTYCCDCGKRIMDFIEPELPPSEPPTDPNRA